MVRRAGRGRPPGGPSWAILPHGPPRGRALPEGGPGKEAQGLGLATPLHTTVGAVFAYRGTGRPVTFIPLLFRGARLEAAPPEVARWFWKTSMLLPGVRHLAAPSGWDAGGEKVKRGQGFLEWRMPNAQYIRADSVLRQLGQLGTTFSRCAAQPGGGWGRGRPARGGGRGARLEAAPPEVARWFFRRSGATSGGAASPARAPRPLFCEVHPRPPGARVHPCKPHVGVN